MRKIIILFAACLFWFGLAPVQSFGQAAGGGVTQLDYFNVKGMNLTALAQTKYGLSLEVGDPNLSPLEGTVTFSYQSSDGRITNSNTFNCSQRAVAGMNGVTRYFQDCINVNHPTEKMISTNIWGPYANVSRDPQPRFHCTNGGCTCGGYKDIGDNITDCASLNMNNVCSTNGINVDANQSGGCTCKNDDCSP